MRARTNLKRERSEFPSLISFREATRQMPALSSSVLRVMNACCDGGLDIRALEQALSQDVGLCSKVLRIANSPLYGLNRKVDTLRIACLILGVNVVHNLIVATELSRVLMRTGRPSKELISLWKHSLGTALCASELASVHGVESGVAFVAGLLHDVGAIILESEFPELARKAREYEQENTCTKLQAEFTVFGFTHVAVGGVLAEAWQLPANVTAAIAAHHESVSNITDSLQRIIVVANCAATLFGFESEKQDRSDYREILMLEGGMHPSELLKLREKVVGEMEKFQNIR